MTPDLLSNTTVLLTGATGFLGAHIAERLLELPNCKLIALKRRSSDTWRCNEFTHQIVWINLDDEDWRQQVSNYNISVVIHAAWNGVAAGDRLAWASQLDNLNLVQQLLELSKNMGIEKFIGLGSQAEYGTFSGIVDENAPANPNTAYGTVKLMALQLVRSFCTEAGINWYWLRLFPLFGEKEDTNWLLPSVIKNMYNGTPMDLTPGMQRYAYLYVKDFAEMMGAIVNSDKAESGIFNISSSEAITLKYLVEQIRNHVNPDVALNFGALPYRSYQTMHMEGNMSRFKTVFGQPRVTSFNESLTNTITYFLNRVKIDG